jgi:hypothetical protein
MKIQIYLIFLLVISLFFPHQGKASKQAGTGNEYMILIAGLSNIADDSTYIYDDGTCETGWSVNPGFVNWLGNFFPVTTGTKGVLKSIEVYFLYKPNGSNQQLSIDVFNSSNTLIGSSSTFTATHGSWIPVNLNDISFSGPFYVMVKWNNISGVSHYLGLDTDGPYIAQDLERLYDGSTFQKLSVIAGSKQGTFLIRAHVLSGSNVGIDDQIFTDYVSVFPNPADNYFEISASEELVQVKMVDVTGKAILEISSLKEKKLYVNSSKIPDGLYLLSIGTTKATLVRKIFIIHR